MWVGRVNKEGVTADQVRQKLDAAPVPVLPPSTSFGGMGELSPGDSGWAKLDLSPGVYVLECSVSDDNSGNPHFGSACTLSLRFKIGSASCRERGCQYVKI